LPTPSPVDPRLDATADARQAGAFRQRLQLPFPSSDIPLLI